MASLDRLTRRRESKSRKKRRSMNEPGNIDASESSTGSDESGADDYNDQAPRYLNFFNITNKKTSKEGIL
jgi:hypothetical protein